MLNPSGEMIGSTVCFGILKVEILGMRGGVEGVKSNVTKSGLL